MPFSLRRGEKLTALPQIFWLDLRGHFKSGQKEEKERKERAKEMGVKHPQNKFLVTALALQPQAKDLICVLLVCRRDKR